MARLEMPQQRNIPPQFGRLLKSYRSKIRRYVEPGTSFSLELVMGCDSNSLLEYVTKEMRPGMTWDGYGTVWCLSNMESPKAYDLSDPDQFMSYFNFRSFKPRFVEEMEGIGAKSSGYPILRGGIEITPVSNNQQRMWREDGSSRVIPNRKSTRQRK